MVRPQRRPPGGRHGSADGLTAPHASSAKESNASSRRARLYAKRKSSCILRRVTLEHRTVLVRCSSGAASTTKPRTRRAGTYFFFFAGAAFLSAFLSALGGSASGRRSQPPERARGPVPQPPGPAGGRFRGRCRSSGLPRQRAPPMPAAALGSAGGGVSLDPPPQAASAVATASGAKSTTDFQVDMIVTSAPGW